MPPLAGVIAVMLAEVIGMSGTAGRGSVKLRPVFCFWSVGMNNWRNRMILGLMALAVWAAAPAVALGRDISTS